MNEAEIIQYMLNHSRLKEEALSLDEARLARKDLARILRALSDPTRLAVFDLLMEGVQCNCEIAERLGLSLSLISHHLSVLRRVGLVEAEHDPEDARWIYYSVNRVTLQRLRREIQQLLDPRRIQPRQPSCGPQKCKAAC